MKWTTKNDLFGWDYVSVSTTYSDSIERVYHQDNQLMSLTIGTTAIIIQNRLPLAGITNGLMKIKPLTPNIIKSDEEIQKEKEGLKEKE